MKAKDRGQLILSWSKFEIFKGRKHVAKISHSERLLKDYVVRLDWISLFIVD